MMGRERGPEPPLPCENQVLNLARLPVPPFGHKCGLAKQIHFARHLLLCQRERPVPPNCCKQSRRGGWEPGTSPSVFLMASSRILNWEWYTPPQNTVLPRACRPRTGTAVRVYWAEVAPRVVCARD